MKHSFQHKRGDLAHGGLIARRDAASGSTGSDPLRNAFQRLFRRGQGGILPAPNGYVVAVVGVLLTMLLRALLQPVLEARAPYLMFMVPVMLAALIGGWRPGLLAAGLGAVAGSLFVAPLFLPTVRSPEDWAQLALFWILCAGVSLTGERLRHSEFGLADRSRQLQESEERFRLLVESLQDHAVFMLAPDGRILTWNTGAERIKGYCAEEVIGQHFSLFYTPEDRNAGLPQRLLELAARQGSCEQEGWRVRKDESRFWADVVLTVLRDPSGAVRGFAKVTRDATERHRAQAALAELAESLEQRVEERTRELAEANEDLAAFNYSASHDLQEPLRAVQGLAQAVLEDYGDRLDAVGAAYLQHIVAAGARMDRLIQDLLAYSRVTRREIGTQPLSLDALVREALRQLEREEGADVSRIQVSSPLPGVRGHYVTLLQVVLNLLTNALKFVPEGEAPEVHVWAERRGEDVRLWIEDRGIGIPPDARERIFQPFERLHGVDTYPGTGIGLAIARRGIERMGGCVGVEPQADRGSRFWIQLPAGVPE